jgi:hypothetical protein
MRRIQPRTEHLCRTITVKILCTGLDLVESLLQQGGWVGEGQGKGPGGGGGSCWAKGAESRRGFYVLNVR